MPALSSTPPMHVMRPELLSSTNTFKPHPDTYKTSTALAIIRQDVNTVETTVDDRSYTVSEEVVDELEFMFDNRN